MDASLCLELRAYIEAHGFGAPTPCLNAELSADDFREHYYDKKELLAFCRAEGLSTQGLKSNLNQRIEMYLRTGEKCFPIPKKQKGQPDSHQGVLALNQMVIHYKSDPVTREFFKNHIHGFTGFSAYVQKWLKERLGAGEEFTYAEVIEEHKRHMKAKSEGRVLTVAHASCQYNQFFKDASMDDEKVPHTVEEAWFLVRHSAGAKTYARYKHQLEVIVIL